MSPGGDIKEENAFSFEKAFLKIFKSFLGRPFSRKRARFHHA